jgi:transcription termination/antitermination protein NusA
VLVDDDTKEATVIVPDDQLSLAIGREGQNARLAAKLTGWKVDIKSQTEFSESDEIEFEGESEESDGRCAAVLSAGRRCPNAALDGSRYCGLPQHQALARFETNQVTVLAGLSDEEVGTLADSDADEGAVAALVERAQSSQPAGQEPTEGEAETAEGPETAPAETEPGAAPDAEAAPESAPEGEAAPEAESEPAPAADDVASEAESEPAPAAGEAAPGDETAADATPEPDADEAEAAPDDDEAADASSDAADVPASEPAEAQS